MTQREIDREVAATLGEDIGTVSRWGFSVADPAEVNFDPEPNILEPNVIDWDSLYS